MDQQPGDAQPIDPRAMIVPPEGETLEEGDPRAAVAQPDKVLRIATMVRELLDETRAAPPDEQGRVMLRNAYEKAVDELSEVLSDDLKRELEELAPPMEGVPTESELRVAQALLVGWLEGLFHGIQATLFTQQMQAQKQFEDMRGRRAIEPGPNQQRPPGAYL